MTENLMKLHLSGSAEIGYSSLGTEDRRHVDAWFDHLRNWRNDEFIRSKSKRFPLDGDAYFFPTSSDFVITFKIAGDEVTVLSIFSKDTVRQFHSTAEPIAS